MNKRYIQNKKIIQSAIGDEVVMMDLDSGFYFGINTVGSDIWRRLVEPISIEELLNQLLREYNIDKSTLEMDTIEFFNQLLEKNLIKGLP